MEVLILKEKKLRKIANRCSSFNSRYSGGSFQSSVSSANRSCTTCSHFTKNNKCELDLIDEIKEDMK